jgi:DNA processing protein
VRRITRDDPGYPERLRALPDRPAVTVSAPLDVDPARRRVAIVGAREALPESEAFAYALARRLAALGVVVVSGGAIGVDRAAHEGALDAGGTTWLVAPNGKNHVSPLGNADLFARVRAGSASGTAMIWPFRDDIVCTRATPRARNAVLVALADDVIVVQARLKSGSRNACRWARSLRRTLWIVPAAPWMEPFSGSLLELARGARPLWSPEALFDVRGATPPSPAQKKVNAPPEAAPDRSWSSDEKLVFSALSTHPVHVDRVVSAAGLRVGATITALLTLSLKNVVVEGPDGFFRRKSAG